VDDAVAKVKPALVRVLVVSTSYREGREMKFESSGSGVIITPDGYVVTNHHVAGRAMRLKCTLANKEEVDAVLIGRDPLTDIAIIKLSPKEPRTFPVAHFGDSDAVRVGDHVLAMGSPMSLSQSVTLGIVSNTELVMSEWMSRGGGGFTLDGENVGSLVRWLGHDADIYGGNSGGPLVNLDGEIIGINEISIGLAGAIPGNLARDMSLELIELGEIHRSWLGFAVQPRLRSSEMTKGILIGGIIADSPAEEAGFEPGDVLIELAGNAIDVRFREEVPGFNQIVADLPIGETTQAKVLRDGKELTFDVKPIRREEVTPQAQEIKEWGATMRNVSLVAAKKLKRDNQDGALITSIRPGGPIGESKPALTRNDVIVEIGGEPVTNRGDLIEITARILEGEDDPVPTIVAFDRKRERFITVVEIGIKDSSSGGREVSKAWLPLETQVLTGDLAEQLGDEDLTGFRVTQIYEGLSADKAGVKVGDLILAIDGMDLEATEPEDRDELPTLIRQYKIGTEAELSIMRDKKRQKILVELLTSPKPTREMPKYENDTFEFTVRDVTLFDRTREKLKNNQHGVLIQELKSGGWAAVGGLLVGDFLLEIDGQATPDVETAETILKKLTKDQPDVVVLHVLRGIHTLFLELEPRWKNVN
jgi:serine protease Do